MNHTSHGIIGGLISMIMLQTPVNLDLTQAVNTLISIVVGLCGSVLTYYLHKWLSKSNPTPPSQPTITK